MAKIRLDRFLANMGCGTRKDVRRLLKEGLVTVDGEKVRDGSAHVDPASSVVEVDGEPVLYRENVYIMMNKPAGVISATEDLVRTTVVDLLPDEYRAMKVFPAGRLDMDSEGLLLLTNDGKLAHNLLAPKKHVPKTYHVMLDGPVTEGDAERFRQGIDLGDFVTAPAELRALARHEAGTWPVGNPGPGLDGTALAEVVISEGKFHQVKRMFAAVGRKVLHLKRVAMGPLRLDESLGPGEFRELTQEELEVLQEYTGSAARNTPDGT